MVVIQDLLGLFAAGHRSGTVDGINVIEFDLAYSNDYSFLLRTMAFLKFAVGSTYRSD